MAKGIAFELYVLAVVRQMLREGRLGLDPHACTLFHRKTYFSNPGLNHIEADVSVEVRRPGATEPFLIVIWECKHYRDRVGEAILKKFVADIIEIGAAKVKGYVVTPIGYSKWAIRYAQKHGLGLWTLSMPEDWHYSNSHDEPTSHVEALTPEAMGCLSVLTLGALALASRRPYYDLSFAAPDPTPVKEGMTRISIYRTIEIFPPEPTGGPADSAVTFYLYTFDIILSLTNLVGDVGDERSEAMGRYLWGNRDHKNGPPFQWRIIE